MLTKFQVANLLSVTLRLKVVEVPLLKQAFGDSICSEHKVLLEKLILRLSEHPDEVELKMQVAKLIS
jgi:hypothetical protein